MLIKPSTCIGCPLHSGEFGKDWGYVPADGTGSNGVLIVLEAAGEDEEQSGRPVVGRAGQYLWQQLQRIGIERGEFRIHNVLSCRPPNNKLIKMPYTEAAIAHCAPNLDQTISEHILNSASIGKTPVIVALGKFAFMRIMGLTERDAIMRADYQTYPHWSYRYNCWVFAAPHPSYIMQGKHNLAPTLQYVIQRAVEVAADGLELDKPFYMLDPTPEEFHAWTNDYLNAVKHRNDVILSYDIETPYKAGSNEDEIAREDEDDFIILRCSFCYEPGNAVSVPWKDAYLGDIQRIFDSGGVAMGWNSNTYDDARIMAQMPMNVTRLDGMLAWHVLNTALPKGLGFVTPFYWKNTPMWKHLSDEMPAFYNAKDADAALRNFIGIKKDLIEHNLWDVFNRHVVQLNEVLAYMSRKGVLLDRDARQAAETKLATLLEGFEAEMQDAVPVEARKLKVYKKEPKDVAGLIQVPGTADVQRCPSCGMHGVKAEHYRSIGKKRLKNGESENPCHGAKSEKVSVPADLWARPLEFKISKLGLTNYQKVFNHKPVKDRDGKVTFDVNAMKTLIKNYPDDPLYPIIGKYRGAQKLLGTYVGVTTRRKDDSTYVRGGMPIGRDGRIHTIYSHNPSTLRLASQQPNMQNLPRPSKDAKALSNIIRNLIIAEPGTTFLARDFSGIEAVLVGYEAKASGYVRLARRDVHSFYTAYALNQLDGRVHSGDLPLLSWDDDKLFTRLGEIKEEFKSDRNNLYKHLVHAINFGQGARGAQETIYKATDIIFDVKLISRLMDIYKELFPEIPKWHRDVRNEAHNAGYLKNAFGYVHRFNHVYANKLKNGLWEQVLGDDAEAVLAFRPQSNAAGIMKEALLRLYFNRFEEAGQYLRMTIHDEIFCQCSPDYVERLDNILLEEMERPVPQLPMPAEWGMGSHLVVLTESKVGSPWGTMR